MNKIFLLAALGAVCLGSSRAEAFQTPSVTQIKRLLEALQWSPVEDSVMVSGWVENIKIYEGEDEIRKVIGRTVQAVRDSGHARSSKELERLKAELRQKYATGAVTNYLKITEYRDGPFYRMDHWRYPEGKGFKSAPSSEASSPVKETFANLNDPDFSEIRSYHINHTIKSANFNRAESQQWLGFQLWEAVGVEDWLKKLILEGVADLKKIRFFQFGRLERMPIDQRKVKLLARGEHPTLKILFKKDRLKGRDVHFFKINNRKQSVRERRRVIERLLSWHKKNNTGGFKKLNTEKIIDHWSQDSVNLIDIELVAEANDYKKLVRGEAKIGFLNLHYKSEKIFGDSPLKPKWWRRYKKTGGEPAVVTEVEFEEFAHPVELDIEEVFGFKVPSDYIVGDHTEGKSRIVQYGAPMDKIQKSPDFLSRKRLTARTFFGFVFVSSLVCLVYNLKFRRR